MPIGKIFAIRQGERRQFGVQRTEHSQISQEIPTADRHVLVFAAIREDHPALS